MPNYVSRNTTAVLQHAVNHVLWNIVHWNIKRLQGFFEQ